VAEEAEVAEILAHDELLRAGEGARNPGNEDHLRRVRHDILPQLADEPRFLALELGASRVGEDPCDRPAMVIAEGERERDEVTRALPTVDIQQQWVGVAQ